ncbi:hypothetical protein VTK73DRAFT_829 [Phialemonium thermophilum]|uniref:Hcy-binding domain-containing protein n=1 Tax=Phialemonium thermophilum TaxID=223376 RepID=A0ABR3VU79_9PEZI
MKMSDDPPLFVLDGGLGTTLEDLFGQRFSSSTTPLWSSHLLVSDPHTLLACQSAFAQAGADILSTATYQVSLVGFAATRTESWPHGVPAAHVGPFLEAAVRIAEQAAAAGPGRRVALSLGPYGATLVPSQEYSGDYGATTPGELEAWHAERLGLFLAGVSGLARRVSYVACETIPRVDEIVSVRKAWEKTYERLGSGEGIPLWISCLFPGLGDGAVATLPDGTSAEKAVETMLDPGLSSVVPWGIGINCTKLHKLGALVERYEAAVRRLVEGGVVESWPALVLYPDGTNGEVYNTTTQRWELPAGGQRPEAPWESQLADIVRATRQRGGWKAILVGGCCKTTPDHIARLRRALGGEVRNGEWPSCCPATN